MSEAISSARAPGTGLRVVSTLDGFDALQAHWSALHQRSGAGIFQTYEWQRMWWKHFGDGRELHLVLLGDDAIAPFYLENVPVLPGMRLRRLSFVGAGLTDYLDVIAAGDVAAVCAQIAAHLATLQLDVVALDDLPDRSKTRAPLLAALQACGFEAREFVSEQCPRTRLQDTWPATLESFPRNLRKKISTRLRHMRDKFGVELDVCRRSEDVERDVGEFIDMHQKRWTSVGRKGAYADASVAAFQREVARVCFDRGWLWVAFMRIGGKRVASLLGYRYGEEFGQYQSGLGDAGAANTYSPGISLSCMCMEALIGEGVRVYDFMRGVEQYKYECAAVDVPNWTLLAFPRAARTAKARNALRLLREALDRRVDQERLLFAHQRREHGLFSFAVLRHLASRVGSTLRDGARKLRAPEKSLTAAE